MKPHQKVRVRKGTYKEHFDAYILFPPKVGNSIFFVKEDETIQTSTLKRWYKWNDKNFGYHTLNSYYHVEVIERDDSKLPRTRELETIRNDEI